MTFEEKIKEMENNPDSFYDDNLSKALRKAIEQRNDSLKVLCKGLHKYEHERFNEATEAGDKELLKILGGYE